MKINKLKLKEIILEEINNMEEIMSTSASADDAPMSKSDLVKQQRATRGADLRSRSKCPGIIEQNW